MKKLEGAAELIRNSFRGTNGPPAGRLCESSWFRSPEAESVCESYRGKAWEDLDVSFLLQNYDAIYFFNDDSFLYYLPAFLLAVLESNDAADHLIDEVVAALSPPGSPGHTASERRLAPFTWIADARSKVQFKRRLARLSEDQRAAIVAFFDALILLDDDAEVATTRAKEYWHRLCIARGAKAIR